MTQVEFAAALGMTPASVYRYEAASTEPTADTLLKLLKLAQEKKNSAAEYVFKQVYYQKSGGSVFNIDQLLSSTNEKSTRSAISFLQALCEPLTDEQLTLLYAVIALLKKQSPDDPLHNVLLALLGPFVGEAEAQIRSIEALTTTKKQPSSRTMMQKDLD